MPPYRTPTADRAAIREIVDGWILWRDCGAWDRLLAAWHPNGRMSSTRFEGLAADFVAQTRRAYEAGARVRHQQSGFWCELAGDRAYAVTNMTICQRSEIDGVPVDVTCEGRFVDFLSFRSGRWALDRRQPAYDRDRLDVVRPGDSLVLDNAVLSSFPEAYRHLAYVQERAGHRINRDLPETHGEGWARLMTEAEAWLKAGATKSPPPRRVIVGERDELSCVDQDELIISCRTPVSGLATRNVWASDSTSDYRTPLERVPWPPGITPPPGGTRFSVVDLAPGYRASALHRTDSLDYVLCLDGQVEMLLDDGSVTLRPGDIAIQRGTNHGWANHGEETARLAVILIDGVPKRDGSIAAGNMAP
jgi:quercetin dioxygenase-like cupin family protein